VRPLSARLPEVMWVLDHQRDLDADFLACYGIDLEVDEISAARYLALAHRVSAYSGVMSARREEEEQHSGSGPAAPASRPREPASEEKQMDLVAFRMTFPGVVAMSKVEGQGSGVSDR